MNIIVNEVEYCKISVQYESDDKSILSKKTEIVNKLKDQKVPGFRQGYATQEAIKQHFRKEINEMLKRELSEEAVQNVITEKNIKPFGRPIFSSINLEDSYLVSISGEPALPKFKCAFSMHTQPEFELKTYKEFEIPKPSGVLPTEELSQRMIQDLRMRYGQTIPYGQDDFVQMGDTIILDLKSSNNGEIIDSLSGSGEILSVGRINIPGFNENLLGMKMEESRDFDLIMPDNHKDFAGKTLHFEVKITMGSKMEPAALDDDLAKKIGVETFGKLMENVRSTASLRVKELESNQTMDQISRRLIENHDFKIPEWISTAEAQINAKNAGHEWDKISDEDRAGHIDIAEKSIKLSLILQKIRDIEPDAQLTDEEVFESAKQNIAKYSQDPEKVMGEIFNNGHLPLLFNRIRDEYALGFIEKTCKVVE